MAQVEKLRAVGLRMKYAVEAVGDALGYVGLAPDPDPPALALDFSQPLPSSVTFTRADAATCATYFGSDGLLKTAAANVARIDYDPGFAVTYGPELATNSYATVGGFDNVTTSVSASSFTTVAGTTDCRVYLDFPVTAGKSYLVSATLAASSIGAANIYARSAGSGTGATINNVGFSTVGQSKSFTFSATSSACSLLFNTGNNASSIAFSSISIREVIPVASVKGLLIEESRTNLLTFSRDMTNAAWSKTDVTASKTMVGLDGVANSACLMTEGGAGTSGLNQTSAAVSAGATVTGSFVIKRGNTDWVRVRVVSGSDGADAWFNLGTGTAGTLLPTGVGSAASRSIVSLGGGWYRCIVTVLPNGTYTIPQFQVNSASGDNSGTRVSGATYIVDCAQLEVGAFPTSIIITDASTKTRAADSASMTGTNFSSWWNGTAGTFVAEWDSSALSAGNTRRAISVTDGTVAERIFFGDNGGPSTVSATITDNSSAVANWTIGSLVSGAVRKTALAFATNDSNVANDGVAQTPDTVVSLPTVDRIFIGSADASTANTFLNGHIRSIKFYPKRLPNTALQAMTR